LSGIGGEFRSQLLGFSRCCFGLCFLGCLLLFLLLLVTAAAVGGFVGWQRFLVLLQDGFLACGVLGSEFLLFGGAAWRFSWIR
jgi:hypothetical protein